MLTGAEETDPPKPEVAPRPGALPCRHPAACVVSSDEGTHWCGWCEEVAALRGLLERAQAIGEDSLRWLHPDERATRSEHADADATREALVGLLYGPGPSIDAALAPPEEG